jgi:puromycin-sensitive aminopeptidase
VETVVPRNGAKLLHLNPGALGFYRVRYDAALLEQLLEQFSTLPPYDRWSILTDLYAFVWSGDLALEGYFQFVRACNETTDYLIVHEIANQLSSIRATRIAPLGALLTDTAAFQRDGLGFFRAQLDRLGLAPVDGEPETDPILRERTALGLLAYDAQLAERLAGHFSEYDRLDPNLREPVAFAYARVGGAGAQSALLDRIGKARNEGDQMKLERALAGATEPELLRQALGTIGTPAVNRAHISVLTYEVALNPVGRDVTWEWMTTRLPDLAASYRGTGLVSDILEHTLPFAALGRGAAVAEAPIVVRPIPEGERGLRKGLEWLRLFESVRGRVSPRP